MIFGWNIGNQQQWQRINKIWKKLGVILYFSARMYTHGADAGRLRLWWRWLVTTAGIDDDDNDDDDDESVDVWQVMMLLVLM